MNILRTLLVGIFIFIIGGCKSDLPYQAAIRQISLGDTIRMVVNQTQLLNPIANPIDITRPYTLTFESGNSNIATVDSLSGMVTATGKGTARIRVKVYENGQPLTNTTSSVVIDVVPYTLQFEENLIKIPTGSSFKPVEKVYPEGAPYTLVWKSDNENIATVSEDGNISAQNEGQTTLTVYIKQEPDVKVSLTVQVGAGEFNPGTGIGDIDNGTNW